MCVFFFVAVFNKTTGGEKKQVKKQTDERTLFASSEVTQICKKNSLSRDIVCGGSFANV